MTPVPGAVLSISVIVKRSEISFSLLLLLTYWQCHIHLTSFPEIAAVPCNCKHFLPLPIPFLSPPAWLCLREQEAERVAKMMYPSAHMFIFSFPCSFLYLLIAWPVSVILCQEQSVPRVRFMQCLYAEALIPAAAMQSNSKLFRQRNGDHLPLLLKS